MNNGEHYTTTENTENGIKINKNSFETGEVVETLLDSEDERLLSMGSYQFNLSEDKILEIIFQSENIKKYAEEVSETKNKNRSKRIGSKSLLNHLKNNFKIPSKRSDLKALFAIIELNLDENDNIEDIREILILLNTILPKLIKKTSTLNHEYTLYRNLIKRAFGERSKIYLDSKTLIKITEQQIKELLQLQQDRVERNNANLIEFDFKDVRNVALEASKNKNNVLDQIIAFQLATGCRLVECLKISEFKAGSIQEANGKIIRYVTQIGVAKDKNADLYNKSTKRVVKPILFFNFEDLEKMLNI